ncbi:hypothetical protein HAX54_043023 [Datura stramonium]|uniref:Uncharacterized protein n=1 Tax=Datura stramonium TaxID=4076 RepID=A0ABS8RPM1_DATST|nr:hypothetical protein [Datura stramonium]
MAERRSSRHTQPPVWLKDFVSLDIHSDISYGMNKYIGYENLAGKGEGIMHETTEFGVGIGQRCERNIFDKLWEILVMTVVVKAMQIKVVLVDFVLADDGSSRAMGSIDGGRI